MQPAFRCARRALPRSALAAACLAWGAPAPGQVRPDAGSTQRDLEPPRLEAPRPAPALPGAPARPALRGDEDQRFTVASLKISGNTAFAAETLLALVRDDLVGKTVTLPELRAVVARITAFYRARGYVVARAYVPAQRIDGAGAQIEIAVLEGVLGSLQLENRSRLSEATVARFAGPLRPGALLTVDDFERPILLLSDQAGVGGVNPVLRPGAATGTSELALGLAPAPLAAGEVGFDNHGNRFTGRYRVSGQLGLNSPLGLGESLGVRVVRSTDDGLTSASLRGVLPVGGDGWRVGAAYAATHYKLGSDFASLQASGTARVARLFASYPLVRTQRWNLNATGTYDARRFEDRVASTATVTPKKTDSGSLALGGDVRDPVWANGVLVWNATQTQGRLSIDEPGARAADAASAATQGSYRKTTLSLLYLQALGGNWTFYGSVSGQRAGKNLDSSEKFSLGGPEGVRAYPAGEAAGDEGELATLELRYALGQWQGVNGTLLFFTDQGHSRISRNPFVAGDNNRSLGAAGIGLTLTGSQDFSLRLYWAVKTRGGAATADADRGRRAWLQAAKYF